MQIILLERVEKLGQMGDTVNVKPGYARNFLLPTGKALRATKENLERFEKQKAQLEARNIELRSEAENVAAKMADTTIVLVRQAGESGQLYGSVNARDVAEELDRTGFRITRSQVRLSRPIKALGLHEVAVSIHPEVSVNISANVARSIEESEIQAKTGKAVLSSAEEEARAESEAAEDSLSVAAEAVAEQAKDIFENGAMESAIVEAENLIEQTDEKSLTHEDAHIIEANAENSSEDSETTPKPILEVPEKNSAHKEE